MPTKTIKKFAKKASGCLKSIVKGMRAVVLSCRYNTSISGDGVFQPMVCPTPSRAREEMWKDVKKYMKTAIGAVNKDGTIDWTSVAEIGDFDGTEEDSPKTLDDLEKYIMSGGFGDSLTIRKDEDGNWCEWRIDETTCI